MTLATAWNAVRVRLTTEVGDPDPRWLYLIRKVCDVSALFVLARYAAHIPARPAALIALGLYTAVGLVEWYASHRFRVGPFLRDVVYHAWIPAIVPALVWTFGDRRLAPLVVVVWLAGWLALELAGAGVVRDPNDPNA